MLQNTLEGAYCTEKGECVPNLADGCIIQTPEEFQYVDCCSLMLILPGTTDTVKTRRIFTKNPSIFPAGLVKQLILLDCFFQRRCDLVGESKPIWGLVMSLSALPYQISPDIDLLVTEQNNSLILLAEYLRHLTCSSRTFLAGIKQSVLTPMRDL